MDRGTHYEIYKKLGSHRVKDGHRQGVYFAVWAPHAKSVSVVGEFNEWDTQANPMKREEPLGIYTCFIPKVQEDMMYKYCIETYTGDIHFQGRSICKLCRVTTGNCIESA